VHAQVELEAPFNWPAPPFFHAAPGDLTPNRECQVEFVTGRKMAAKLLRFEPELNFVAVQVPGQPGPEGLDLQNVRLIKLVAKNAFVHHVSAILGVGASEAEVPIEKDFVVSFRDKQKKLRGKTRGFIRNEAGVFLFLLADDPSLTTSCFIPAQQVADVQIGPMLGEVLTGKKLVSDEALSAALSKQAALRQEQLGKQLIDRAIVSAEELKQALQKQRQLPRKMRLGEILIEEGVITPEQLAEALSIQAERRGRRLGDILIDMGIVTPRLVQMVLSDKLGIPYVNVREFKIDPTVLDLLSAHLAIKDQVLPLLLIGTSLVVAVESPLSLGFSQDVRFATGLAITPVMANPEDLKLRILKEYSSYDRPHPEFEPSSARPASAQAGDGTPGDLSQVRVEELTMELAKGDALSYHPAKDKEEDLNVTDNALVRLVNKIIIEAHAQGASDIHIEANPGTSATRIRFRKDGELEDYLELRSSYRNALVSRLKIMAGLDIAEHRHGQDGKINFARFGPLPIELRVAVVPTSNGLEDIVMRILGGVEPLPIDKLGLCERDLEELKRMVTRSYGLILVCGPTGSGKTTTLHSVLHHINRPDIKIWTAEDPVEITQPGLRQVQINSRIDWTFANAMRAFLRADPDVIMVGEMRDPETTKIGIEASLTGHLVFSTLHTNSAAESVVRLLEFGMDPFNFADALIGILSQRLARKLCPKCKRSHPASENEISDLLAEYCAGSKLEPATVLAQWRTTFGNSGQILLYEAVGCKECKNGYRGRTGIYELLSSNSEVKHLIRIRGTVPQIVDAAQAGGLRLLRQDAIEKVLGGLLDLICARSVAN